MRFIFRKNEKYTTFGRGLKIFEEGDGDGGGMLHLGIKGQERRTFESGADMVGAGMFASDKMESNRALILSLRDSCRNFGQISPRLQKVRV